MRATSRRPTTTLLAPRPTFGAPPFFFRRRRPTRSRPPPVLRQTIRDRVMPIGIASHVTRVASDFAFFHWGLEFPAVMARGGFDVVLGNPPWAALSPDRREFFAQYDPSIRSMGKDGQDALVTRLLAEPATAAEWKRYRRGLFALVHFLKNAGRYTLYAPGNLGKGDFNIYRPFVELALRTTRAGGRAAQVVPSGLYNGANTSAIRQHLFDECTLIQILSFDNEQRQWFDVSVNSVCVYVARAGGRTTRFATGFGIASESDVRALAGRLIETDADEVRRQAPATYALSEVKNLMESRVVQKMQAAWPAFGDQTAPPPHRHFLRELDMGNDRERFNSDRGLPVYEGRMIDRYDHRAKTYREGHGNSSRWDEHPFGDPLKVIRPQWYVAEAALPGKLGNRPWRYRLGFANIADPRSARSVIASVIPAGCVCGDKVPTIDLPPGEEWAYPLVLAVANSFVFDFLARTRLSAKTLTFTIFDSLPMPRLQRGEPAFEAIAPLVVRLVCTGPEMLAFWNEMAEFSWVLPTTEPIPPGLLDETSRAAAEARIDAIVARDLYGLTRDELEYILDSFDGVIADETRRLGEYRSKRLVLGEFDAPGPERLAGAGRPQTSARLSPSGSSGGLPAREASTRAGRGETRKSHTPSVSVGKWQPEASVEVNEILVGSRVRHRTKGTGTVLGVNSTSRRTDLLIRFDAGREAWIVLGLGFLEFAADSFVRGDRG